MLNQWRAYADGGEGYSIGVDADGFAKINKGERYAPLLARVEYDEGFQNDLVKDGVESILALLEEYTSKAADEMEGEGVIKAGVLGLITFSSVCSAIFKDAAYSEEKEWRLVGIGETLIGRVERKKLERIRYRNGRRGIIPYIDMKFDPSYIKEVIAGPKNDYEGSRNALHSLLWKNGANPNEVKITKSGISYR